MTRTIALAVLVAACADGADPDTTDTDTDATDPFSDTTGWPDALLVRLACDDPEDRDTIDGGIVEVSGPMADRVDLDGLWGEAIEWDRDPIGRVFRPTAVQDRRAVGGGVAVALNTSCHTETEIIRVLGPRRPDAL